MQLNKHKIGVKMQAAGFERYSDLAAALGVIPGTLSAYFANDYLPSGAVLERMCSVLNCTVDEIVDYNKMEEVL